ncbi:unnamed protein product [Orchesella dallaii]|uniref:Integrase catalytic domain-containing protein n=1 Tax=Orchesella dallaii TaxID=48710 RepID=A0ABP1PZ02_9HEXA
MFAAIKTSTMHHKKYAVKIGRHGGGFTCEMRMRSSERICNPIPRIPRSRDLFEQLQRNRIFVNDVDNDDGILPEIELLIGTDNYGRLLTGKVIQLAGGITAQETLLGWVLSGEDHSKSGEDIASMMILTMTASDAPIEDMWRLECIGIEDDTERKTAEEREKEQKEDFMKSIRRNEDGRYCIGLPFLKDHPPLPSNKAVCLNRLERTTKKLFELGKFDLYDKLLREWSTEFTEVVPTSEIYEDAHYIPHRPVFKESLTTPVRPVFDCSCKIRKYPSLNDILHTGSSFIQLIPELLLRFREKKIGVTSDIRKAFQMIEVKPEDRKYLRFLWWEDYVTGKMIEYQHQRVLFGATCSPFILGVVLEFHLTHLAPPDEQCGRKLLEGFYVDNYIGSEDTMEEYHTFRNKATSIMAEARMDLRMWMSNGDQFEDTATLTTSILGLKWDRTTDELFVPAGGIKIPEELTKRTLLSVVHKVFDPLGFLAPALIPMKIILQKTWINKMKWDQELPKEEARVFMAWFEEMPWLQKIRIPRLATDGQLDKTRWSLHTFTDASGLAYACVVYLRVQGESGVSVQLLMSKARVAPVKAMTIPRLELMGCLLGVRILTTVKKALGLEKLDEYFWSDSTTALAWIKREYNHDTFVRNRVKEIRAKSMEEDWRHVPGLVNPADLPSRGCSPKELLQSKWWEGPEWLKLPYESWPSAREEEDMDAIMAEVKKNVSVSTTIIMDGMTRDFTYAQTLRIMGWVRRAIYNFKNWKTRNKRENLSADEIRAAELTVLKQVQDESFLSMSDLKGLNVFRSGGGLIRLKTRLIYRDDLASFKTPIVLPSKHPLVSKLIMETHRKNCHGGVNFLMGYLREKYWIIHGRRTIKRGLSRCFRCRRYAAKAAVVEEAPLPEDRIKNAEPFEVTGVDLAGPLLLKNKSKVWIVLYTCAVYRAVFLDLVSSLSTRAFVKSLGRFMEKHGRPAVIYSDNGTNFVGANNLFKEMDWETIRKVEEIKPIQWKFNPPASAWWGGWWERLVRTVKDLLRKTIGKGVVNQSELYTLLKKVEEVINNRPITYVSEDSSDLEALTPAMFLRTPSRVVYPEGESTESLNLRIRHQYMTTLKEELRRRFRSEYLALLVSKPKKLSRELRVGELVFVGSDQVKRLHWKLGRILEFLSGKDGVQRLARVKSEDKKILVPAQRLYPLELDHQMAAVIRTRSGRNVKVPERLGINN